MMALVLLKLAGELPWIGNSQRNRFDCCGAIFLLQIDERTSTDALPMSIKRQERISGPHISHADPHLSNLAASPHRNLCLGHEELVYLRGRSRRTK